MSDHAPLDPLAIGRFLAAGGNSLLDQLVDFAHASRENLIDNFVLRGEMIVDASRLHAGSLGNLPKRRFAVALTAK